MAFLDDKAEVIVAVDIEGIGEGRVGQLGIRRQIFTCDCVIQFDGTRRLGKEQAKGGIFVIAARHFADARLCGVFFLRCGICVLIFLRFPPAVILNTISFINSIFLLYHKRNYISSMILYYLTVYVFYQTTNAWVVMIYLAGCC